MVSPKCFRNPFYFSLLYHIELEFLYIFIKNREQKSCFIRLISESAIEKGVSLLVPKEKNSKQNLNMDTEILRLMDTYGNDVLRISYMYLKDVQKAEDAFQEVFIKIYNKYKTFRGDSSEKTWITRITINVCKDMLKSSWLKRIFLTDEIGHQYEEANVENFIIKKNENRMIFNQVVSLPPVYKDVIILYYYQDFDTAEISKILNIAEGTVRSRLHRAREILKKNLGGRIDVNG